MKIQRWLGALFFLLVLVLLLQSPKDSSDAGVPHSVRSRAPNGRLALFALLDRLGYAVHVWDEPSQALSARDAWLWMPRLPSGGESQDPSARQRSHDAFDSSGPAYRRFIKEGGTLVVPAGRGIQHFLNEILVLDVEVVSDRTRQDGQRTLEVEIKSGERLQLFWSGRPVTITSETGRGEIRDLAGELLCQEIGVGLGRVLILQDDRFLHNARIAAMDCALFGLRLMEHFGPPEHIYFDEFVLGVGTAPSLLGVAFGARLGTLSLPLVVFFFLLAWRQIWVREFPRDPPAREGISPLARARSLAGLYLRAGHGNRLRERYVAYMLTRLQQRLHLARETGAPATSRAILARLCSHLACQAEEEGLARELEREVTSHQDLDSVRAALARLEARALRDPLSKNPVIA